MSHISLHSSLRISSSAFSQSVRREHVDRHRSRRGESNFPHVSALEGNMLFQHARTQIVSTVDEARDMVWNLRHAEKVDLASSLEALARQALQAFGIDVVYTGVEPPGMVSHLAGHEVLMIAPKVLANFAMRSRTQS